MAGWKECQCPGFKFGPDLINYVILGRAFSFSGPLCTLKIETLTPN